MKSLYTKASFFVLSLGLSLLQLSTAAQYCASGSSSATSSPQIVNVTLNTINNTTPNSPQQSYSDFTGLSTVITAGNTYTLSIATRNDPGSSTFTKTLTVYIDWNQDNVFANPGERIYVSPSYTGTNGVNTINTTTFTVPAIASSGSTRMRVILRETSTAEAPCTSYAWGETEDYTVRFCPAADGIKIAAQANPVCNGGNETFSLTGLTSGEVIQWQSSTNGVTYTDIAGASGASVNTGSITQSTYYRALITKNGCTAPTAPYYKTTIAIAITAGPSNNICYGGESQLNIDLPTDYYKAILTNVSASTPINSKISVAGLPYPIIASDIKEVCINTRNARLTDLDVYLISPQGTQIELSTDNPNNTGNASYTYTCFKPTAVTPITAGGGSFLGDYLPEQPFSSFDGENPNGDWTLKVENDGSSSILFLDWSLGFNVKINWRLTDAGLSAYNIPNPIARPLVNTTYEATLSNNGSTCTTKAQTTIVVGSRPTINIAPLAPFCFDQSPQLNATVTPTTATTYSRKYFNLDDYVIPDGGVGGGILGGWNGTSGTFVDIPIMVSCLNPKIGKTRISRVCFNAVHGRATEMEMYLVAPDNSRMLLMNGIGGANAISFTNTCFVSTAARPVITGGTAPYTGDFRPMGNGNNFTGTIDQGNMNGVWKLRVGDDLTFDTGKIQDWSIEFSSDNEVVTTLWTPTSELSDPTILNPRVIPQTDGNKTLNLYVEEASCCKNDQNVSFPVSPKRIADAGLDFSACASDVITLQGKALGTATGGSWTSPSGGTFSDPNSLTPVYTPSATDIANGSVTLSLKPTGGNTPTAACPDVNDDVVITFTGPLTTISASPTNICNGGQLTLNSTTTLLPATKDFNFSNNTSINIPDRGQINSTINVDGILPCSPATNWTLDKVCMNINHTFDPDLDIFLIGSNGSRLELTTDNGNGGNRTNYRNTCFTATATNNITGGNPPFTGNYRPEGGPLSFFTNFNPNGNWTLEVTDDLGGDTGTLLDWSISFKTTNSVINRSWTASAGGAITSPSAQNTVVTTSGANPSTTFTLAVNDAYCCATTVPITITPTPAITATKSANKTLCEGQSTGLLVTPAGGNGAYVISWTSSPAGFAANTASITVSPLVTTTYTATITSGACTRTETITVTVNPKALVDPGTYAAICQTSPVSLNGVITAGGTPINGTWTVNPFGSGTFTNASVKTTTFNPTQIGTHTLTLTSADPDGAGPCSSVAASTTITVQQPALISRGQNSISICQDQLGVPVSGDYQFADSANWSVVPAGAVAFASTVAKNNTFNATVGFFGNATITYTTNDPAGPCPAVSIDIPLTVSQKGTVNAGLDAKTCENTAININANVGGSATAGSWTAIPAAAGTFVLATSKSTSFTPAVGYIGTVTLRFTTNNTSAPCNQAFDDVDITVVKKQSVNVGADQTICQGTLANITATVLNSSAGGNWTVSPAGAGTFAAFNNRTTTFTPNINFSGVATLTFTNLADAGSPCPSVSDDLTVTVNPRAIVNTGTYPAICETQTLTLNGDIRVNGFVSTGTWTAFDTLNNPIGTFDDPTKLNAVFDPNGYRGDVTLILTSSDPDGAGPCLTVSSTTILKVDQKASVTAGSDQVICQGVTSVPLGGMLSGSATTSNWTVNPTSAGVFEDPSDRNTRFIPDPNFNGAAVLTIRITTNDPNGPCPAAFKDVQLTLQPKAIVDPGTYSPICIGSTLALSGSIDFGGMPLTGDWSIVSGGTGSFLPTTGESTVFTPTTSGTYVLRLTSEDPNGPCVSEFKNVTVVVNKLPVLTFPNLGQVCRVANAFNFSTAKPIGGKYYINNIETPNFNPQDLAYPENTPITVEYRYTDPTTNCSNIITSTITITTNPLPPTVPDVDICVGGLPIIQPESTADQFLWYLSDLAGEPVYATTDGAINNGALDESATIEPISGNLLKDTPGTYTYFVRASSGGGLCTSDPKVQVTINVRPIPNDPIVIAGTQDICSGNTGTFAVTSPDITVFSFQWYDAAGNLLIKAPDYTTPIIINAGTTPVAQTFTVESVDENFPSKCVSSSRATVTLNINPLPETPTASDVSVCSNDNLSVIALTPDPTNNDFIWFTTPISTSRKDSTDILNLGDTIVASRTERFYYFNAINQYRCVSTNRGIVKTVVTPLPVIAKTQKNVSCFSGSDGTVVLRITSGTPAIGSGLPVYKLDLDGNPISPIPDTVKNLSKNDYQFTVTDSVGCIATELVGITEPTVLLGNATGTDLNCFENKGGKIDFTGVTGGTTPYLYSVDGINFQGSPNFTGLDSADYNTIILDALGCKVQKLVKLDQPDELTGIATKIRDVQCFGTSTGATDVVKVDGGVPTYTFEWQKDGVTTVTTKLNDNIPFGEYDVKVTDANGCELNSAALTVTQPEILTLDFAKENVKCNGELTGTINLVNTGGTTPYTFVWADMPTLNSPNRTNLAAGSYQVSVTDALGCSVNATINISQPSTLSFTKVTSPLACFNDNSGSVVINGVGGTPPYKVDFTGNALNAPANFTGLAAGNSYTAKLTDDQGCFVDIPFTITEPAALTNTIDLVKNVSCFNGTDGSINTTTTGGTVPYTYLWNNSATSTTEDVTGLSIGTYQMVITDDNGCKINSEATTITQPDELQVSELHNQIDCFNDLTGFVSTTISGGTMPYSISWKKDGLTEAVTTKDRINMAAGTYELTVTDALGCPKVVSFSIDQPSKLDATVTKVDLTCFGENIGEINIAATGGTLPYSFSIDGTAGTTDFNFKNLPAGNYNAQVIDGLGCEYNQPIIITTPTDIVLAAVDAGDIKCFGNTTVDITVTATGGTGALSYSWNSGQTTKDLVQVGAGSYQLTATDTKGCKDTTTTIVVLEPSDIQIQTLSTDVPCSNDAVGTITVTVTGGTVFTDYSYLWDTGETTKDRSGLKAGKYTVFVTDNNQCVDSIDAYVTEPNGLIAVLNKKDLLCNNDNSGVLIVEPQGGIAPYTVTIDGGITNNEAPRLYLGQAAGTYTVTLSDANGCLYSQNLTLTEPAPLVASINVVDIVKCFNDFNGKIASNTSGGSAPYTYTWFKDGLQISDVTDTIFNLGAGAYYATVTDFNNCSVTTNTINLANPAAMNLATNATSNYNTFNISCFGLADGSAEAIATGGTSPLAYNWSNSTTLSTISAVSAGSYDVEVTDANGCKIAGSIVLNQPDTITPSANITSNFNGFDIACFNGANGTALASAIGGVSPYNYSWSNGTNAAGVNNLRVGANTVTITDRNGCKVTKTLSLTQPTPLNYGMVTKNLNCFQSGDGALFTTVTGGVPAYTFAWGNSQTGSSISNLNAGTYTLRLTDNNGCFKDTSVTITQPLALLATATPSAISCNGLVDGQVSVLVNSGTGTAPYTYSWNTSPVRTTPTITNLAAGVYTVTITDKNGCTITRNATVTEPSPIVSTVNVVDVTCFGFNDGSATLNTTVGGTAPFTYKWSNGATGITATNLIAGNYNLITTDANGCISAPTAFTVNQPAQALAFVPTVKDVACFGQANGTITIAVTGGNTGVKTFNWTDGPTTLNRTGLIAGVYTLRVTDTKNCTTQQAITVKEPTILTVAVTDIDSTSCELKNEGYITVTPKGGIAPYTYSWNTGKTTARIDSLFGNLNYTVTVTDFNNCKANLTQRIYAEPVPISDFELIAPPCSALTAVIKTFPTNGKGSWGRSEALGLSFTLLNKPSATDTSVWEVSTRNFDLFNLYWDVDRAGCVNTKSGTVDFKQSPVARFNYLPNKLTTVDNEALFTNTSLRADTNHWNFYNTILTDEFEPRISFPSKDSGTYNVCLRVVSDNGCDNTKCVSVFVNGNDALYLPNAFTPNGDGKNEVFVPVFNGIDVTDYHIIIFNRWGEIVFESNNPLQGWDGFYKGILLPPGTFAWRIEYKQRYTVEREIHYGSVNLIH